MVYGEELLVVLTPDEHVEGLGKGAFVGYVSFGGHDLEGFRGCRRIAVGVGQVRRARDLASCRWVSVQVHSPFC